MERTRTGTATGITETFQQLSDLLLTDEPRSNYADVLLENTGNKALVIATGLAAPERGKTLPAGKEMFLPKINLLYTFVKTVDDSGSNILEFIGTPQE